MSTKRERMYEEIAKHGANLNTIFQTEFDDVTLCKKLRQIEMRSAKVQLDYCNGGIDMNERDRLDERDEKSPDKILHYKEKNIPVFLNGDPRGYTLKIQDEFVREHNLKIRTDWGGYGILAPDFTEN